MESTPEHVIEISQLTKVFSLGFWSKRRFEALSGVDLKVFRGRAHGFLGPNGAGKTTTIKILNHLIFPTSGLAKVFGGEPGDSATKQRLGYLPENPTFPDHLTGREVLMFYGQLVGLSGAALTQRVEIMLDRVRMKYAKDIQVRRYSKGMVQRLGIAQSMLHDPELIIWDEPMSGLDPIGRREVKELMQELNSRGKTLFFSTHIISDVEEICEDVSIVVGGKVTRAGVVKDLLGAESGQVEVRAQHLPADFDVQGLPVVVSGSQRVFTVESQEAAKVLVERIWAAKGTVMSLQTRRTALEDVFLAEVRRSPLPNRLVED